MNETLKSADHERIELLLPWYVNNTLEITEREAIQRHSAGCKECRAQIELLSSVQSGVSNGSPTPIVPNANIAKLLAAIDSGGSTQQARPVSRRFIALAASVATAFVVIAIILVNQSQTQQPPTRFETATSADQVAPMDYVLDILFDAGTVASAREQILQQIDAKNIVVAEHENNYRVTVSLQLSSLDDLERYTNEVESLPRVDSVSVIAMQLPVTTPE